MKKVMVLLGAVLMLGCNNGSSRNAEVIGNLVVSTAASSPVSRAIPAAQASKVLQVQFEAQDSAVKVAGLTLESGNTAVGGGSAEFDRLVIKTSQGVLADINPVDFPVQVMFGEPLIIGQDSSKVLSVEVTPKSIAEGSHRVSTALGFYLTVPTEEILATTESGRNDVPVTGAAASEEFWIFRTVPKVKVTAPADARLECGMNTRNHLATIEIENPLPNTGMVVGKISMKLAVHGAVEVPFANLYAENGQPGAYGVRSDDGVIAFYPVFGPLYIGGGRTFRYELYGDVLVADCSDENAGLVVNLASDADFSDPLPANFQAVDEQSNFGWTDLSWSGLNNVFDSATIQWSNGFAVPLDGEEIVFHTITRPLNPQIVGTYTTGLHYPHVVGIRNNSEVVLGGSYGFQTVSTEPKQHPYMLGSLYDVYSTFELKVVGNTAYIDYYSPANGQYIYGLGTIDITDHGQPKVLGVYRMMQSANKIEASGNLVFAAMATKGLLIFDASDPATLMPIGQYNRSANTTSDSAGDIVVNGSLAYLAYNNAGLDILDISDPTNPRLLGNYREGVSLIRTIGRIDLVGNMIYASSLDDGFRVIDVSDPTNPQRVSYNPAVKTFYLKVVGKYAFTTFFDQGLRILDVSQPGAPVVATVNTGGDCRGVAVLGRYCYVANRLAGLQIIDLYSE